MKLPEPVMTEHEGFLVVRDDLLPGGTKRRAVAALFDDDHREHVYASPVYGHAQLALAHAAADHGRIATIFCAQRVKRHPLTQQTLDEGAKAVEVPHGYLSVVQARARDYCSLKADRVLLPFGFDTNRFITTLAGVAEELPITPTEVWTVMGSGVLSRALQLAWPEARVYGVQIGAQPNAGRAQVFVAPEAYDKEAILRPPWPACSTYDAKIWRFMKAHATPGALCWNVA